MKSIPGYVKIITLGSAMTENALLGRIVIQEKVDGSQFRFGIDDKGEVVVGTKGTIINHPDENKMFKQGAEYIFSMESELKKLPINTYFYGEYLQSPKHNVLKYKRTPTNHIVLFDCVMNGKYCVREELNELATRLSIDLIPQLFDGTLKDRAVGGGFTASVDFLKRLVQTTPSYLGNELIEGCVIKNYDQKIEVFGHIWPLFTKYVREEYKERHHLDWDKNFSRKGSVDEFIKGFQCEARWQKAIIHMKEKGLLTNSPKDIGALIKEVQKDITEEESENIKKFLYEKHIGEIERVSVRGLAEWYKNKLLDNLRKE